MGYKRKSYKYSNAKKATWFKKGHNVRKQVKLNLPNEEFPSPAVDSTQSKRLTLSEACEVQHLTEHQNEHNTLPYRLRPAAEREQNSDLMPNSDENIIVNFKKLQEFTEMVHSKCCTRPKVELSMSRTGLCVSITASCSRCKFRSQAMDMSEKIPKARGPAGGALNEMLLIPVMKSKMGIDDVLMVMTCMNIKAPSRSLLQRKLNSLSDIMIDMNEAQMLQNQQEVKHLTEQAGLPCEVNVQTDTAFASRPQSSHEKAQQSVAATIEHTTKKKRIIALSVANKHCNIKDCNHQNCHKNFSKEQSIASSERSLLQENMNKLKKTKIVRVKSITTDGSSQLAKAVRDFNSAKSENITHYQCFIHKQRTLEKHIKNLSLKTVPSRYNKTTYMQKLASCIRTRVRLELQSLHALKKNTNSYIGSCILALENIVPCFSGNHVNCKLKSMVCKSHLESYTTKFLPWGVHLEIDGADRKSLKNEIMTVYNTEALKKTVQLFNTNMCESFHSTVFSYASKSICWARNFAGMCHSAAHTRTLGRGMSTVGLARAVGIKVTKRSSMMQQLVKLDERKKYDSHRKSTKQYRENRYFQRKKKSNRLLYQDSLYSAEPSTSSLEHNYGLSF